MDSERLIELHGSFSRKHISILIGCFCFMIINILFRMEEGAGIYVPCAVMCGIVLTDTIFSIFSFFHKFNLLRIMKLIEIFTAGFFICFRSSSSIVEFIDLFMISFFVLFCVELGYVLDLAERTNVIVGCLVFHIPYLFKILSCFINNDLNDSFNYLVVASISYLILYCIYSYIGELQKYNEQLLYSKDRVIDRAKEKYTKVTENQTGLMEANEQLGIKKFELEEAYRKINLINADINFQNKIMRIVSSSLNLDEVLHKCSDAIIDNQNDIIFANILFKDKNMRKNFNNGIDKIFEPKEFKTFADFFLSADFIDGQLESGTFYINNDVSFEEFPFFERMDIRSIIVKTIRVQSEEYASVFVIMSRFINAFHNKETLYDNILRQIQVAANNIFMYNKIRELSNRDGLSGLYNRRYLNLYFNEHFTYNEINGTAIASLLDIDHFKSINDTYGHLFGDQAIITVADVINEYAARYEGLTFRYGGEEFVVLFEKISLDEAVDIMENIRRKIKKTPITHEGTTTYVNVSIGVAAYPDTTKKLSDLIDRADKAMYYSKQNGRDRLTVDNGQD